MIPTRPVWPRKTCPNWEIVLIWQDPADEVDIYDMDNTWHFGPQTINPWPQGDYYSGGVYEEPACMRYPGSWTDIRNGDLHEYRELDRDYLMDTGL